MRGRELNSSGFSAKPMTEKPIHKTGPQHGIEGHHRGVMLRF